MDTDEDIEHNDEENCWELWDRWRRMAVVQVLCYAVYAIYMCCLYYHTQCNESAMSVKGKKWKSRAWEREFKEIREEINNVAEAITEGNDIFKKAWQHVYSEREVYAELVKIGVEKHLQYTAYNFLIEEPARVRAFFGCPIDECKDF